MKTLVTEPIVTFLSLYVAFNFAVLFTFFASVPYVFGLVYHFDRGNTGLVFLAIGLGCTCAPPTCILLDKYVWQKEWTRCNSEGRPEAVAAEHRLWAAMLGAFGLPIGLFWSGSCILPGITTDLFLGLHSRRGRMCIGLSPSLQRFPLLGEISASMYCLLTSRNFSPLTTADQHMHVSHRHLRRSDCSISYRC
jgi:hypothetical protein